MGEQKGKKERVRVEERKSESGRKKEKEIKSEGQSKRKTDQCKRRGVAERLNTVREDMGRG